MKQILIILFLLMSYVLARSDCDTKGTGIPIYITVQPGSTWTETFDFRDCQFGLRNNHFLASFKGKSISGELLDVTTGISYGAGAQVQGGIVWYCVNNCESLKGHLLTLTLHNDGRKPITVEVQRSVCYCGG